MSKPSLPGVMICGRSDLGVVFAYEPPGLLPKEVHVTIAIPGNEWRSFSVAKDEWKAWVKQLAELVD